MAERRPGIRTSSEATDQRRHATAIRIRASRVRIYEATVEPVGSIKSAQRSVILPVHFQLPEWKIPAVAGPSEMRRTRAIQYAHRNDRRALRISQDAVPIETTVSLEHLEVGHHPLLPSVSTVLRISPWQATPARTTATGVGRITDGKTIRRHNRTADGSQPLRYPHLCWRIHKACRSVSDPEPRCRNDC